MASNGAVALRVKGLIPFSWYELSRAPEYGDSLLFQAIDIVEWTIFGRVLTDVEEAGYGLMVCDFLAKLAAIEIIPAAIELWMNKPIVISATGTNETESYEARIQLLKDLREAFIKETRAKMDEIAVVIGDPTKAKSRALLNTIDDPFLTPSPQEFPRPFAETEFS